MFLRPLLIFSLFFIISKFSFAKTRTNTKIIFPANIILKSINISFDNGKTEENVSIKDTKGFLNKDFFSEYASIKISYVFNNGNSNTDIFFVNDKPSIIEYIYLNTDTSKLNYKLSNAYDFKISKNKLLEFTKNEYQVCKEFLDKYSDSIFNNRPVIDSIYNSKFSALSKKELQFISMNSSDYYFKWYFRRNHLKTNLLDKKFVSDVFYGFPKSYIESKEGIFIKAYLNSLTSFKKGEKLPFFRVKDINNNFISLENFKFKKNVLIVFWATWCIPCVKEIPKIKQIKNMYNDLEIIFISYDTDKELFLSKIKEFQMDWVHIFNDIDLINSYGSYKAIPRVYLINKNGYLIYDRDQDNDFELTLLDSTLVKLFK